MKPASEILSGIDAESAAVLLPVWEQRLAEVSANLSEGIEILREKIAQGAVIAEGKHVRITQPDHPDRGQSGTVVSISSNPKHAGAELAVRLDLDFRESYVGLGGVE